MNNFKRLERLRENVTLEHQINIFEPELLGLRGDTTFKTSITIRDVDKEGRTIRLYRGHTNKTVMGGRTMIQEQYFGIRPNPQHHLTLNELLEIPHTTDVYSDSDNKLYKQREVRYFCIGNGAENTAVSGTSFEARNSETSLYNTVPFRCVPESADLSELEAQNYRLRKKIIIKEKTYIAYYAKKMELENLFLTWNGNDYVPVREHTVAGGLTDHSHPLAGSDVKVFSVFNLSIDKNEFKEWYKITHGTLQLAKLSELGMIAAYDAPLRKAEDDPDNGRMELATAELASKMTHSPIPMDSESHSRKIRYSIFS